MLPVNTHCDWCTCTTICTGFRKIWNLKSNSRNRYGKRTYWNTPCNKYMFVLRMQIKWNVKRCVRLPIDPRRGFARQRTPIARKWLYARTLLIGIAASRLQVKSYAKPWTGTSNVTLSNVALAITSIPFSHPTTLHTHVYGEMYLRL